MRLLSRWFELFALLTVALVLSACGGGGSSDKGTATHVVSATSGTGGSIGPGSRIVGHGATATFTVTPDTGFNIATVSGCGGSLDGNIFTTAAVMVACTVRATFALNEYNVSVTAGPGGRIDPTRRTVTHGATATFTVVPDAGYRIEAVTGCGGSLARDLYIIGAVTGSCAVTASFVRNTYTVSAAAGAGGKISPTIQVISHGDAAVLTLEREPGFGISRVTGCGGTRVGNTYTTAPIVESCAVEAIFGKLVVFGTHPLNDTGIDWCADAANNYDLGNAAYKTMQCEAVTNAGFPGQDGHFGRDALARAGEMPKIGDGLAGFDYTKISNSGSELPATATLGGGPGDWACTRDNLTGLTWEVKVDDETHLRYKGHYYSWYDPNSPDGNPGTPNGGAHCVGSACDTSSFVDAVNAQGLCGASDWRMPTRSELSSIVHFGRSRPAIDLDYFPDITESDIAEKGIGFFVSGSPGSLGPDSVWAVNFFIGLGSEQSLRRYLFHNVRLVRD